MNGATRSKLLRIKQVVLIHHWLLWNRTNETESQPYETRQTISLIKWYEQFQRQMFIRFKQKDLAITQIICTYFISCAQR